jgi:8-hydroxy-5-deazaflavin:NADPH oxidoreductase
MAIAPTYGLGRRDFFSYLAAGATLALLSAGPRDVLAQSADVAALKIGMIGAGREGGALGRLFAQHGNRVMFATRNPDQLGDLVASVGPNASAGTVADAVAFGDVVFIVVPYTAVQQIATDYGKGLATKLAVVDVSNPIARRDGEDFVRNIMEQGGPGLVAQKLLPGVRLVRAFNAIGAGKLAELSQRKGEIGVPIAGDDPQAVELVSALIRRIGFEPVLVGGLAMGKYLVPGTPLAGEHSPAELRQIAATLK